MTNCELNFAALESCLQALDHFFIEISRLKSEPEYEEKRGGYGDVHVATLDSGTSVSRLVAAKTIRLKARHREPQRVAFVRQIRLFDLPDVSDSLCLQQRLARELRVWARLQHPHVLPLLGYFLDKDYKIAVLISEYMVHGDLKDYIEQKRPAWGARLQLIRDATDGLAYLHGQNPPILHGDLKAGNVLINAELRASLADFGLSKALEAGPTGLTTSDGLKGTLRYYSPELMSESNPDRCLPSDIWAWACLALEAWTDTLPYATKKTEQGIIIALMKGYLPSDTESLPIPVPDLKLLLAKCWTITPIERPSAASCLRILNLVSPSSQASIHVGKIAVQENPKQPGLRLTDSSVSPTNIGSGARPQNNADRGSKRNGERSEEKYEDAEPSGSSTDKFELWSEVFQERIPSLKALRAAKASRDDTSRAIGPSSKSAPSQLNARIPQQRQARNKESKARPIVGSAPTQPKFREPAQTSQRTQLGPPSSYGYDTYATRLSFPPPPAFPPFQMYLRPGVRVPPSFMQYGAFSPLPGGPFPGSPPVPPPPAPFSTGPWPPDDQTIFMQFPAPPQPFPQTCPAYGAPGRKQHPHTSTNATTSSRVPETPSTISRKTWAKLYKRKKDAFRARREAERPERERQELERRKAPLQKRSPEGEDLYYPLETTFMDVDGERAERLICKLDGMNFSVRTYPFLPQVVNEESKKNRYMLDDQIIVKVLERVMGQEELPAPATQGGPS